MIFTVPKSCCSDTTCHTLDAVASGINKAEYDALQNPETRSAFEATGNTARNISRRT